MAKYKNHTLKHAIAMRKDPTLAEKALWHLLRSRGLSGWKFRRQQPIGSYISDFACSAGLLIVDTLGDQHVENAYDVRRETILAALQTPSPTSARRQAAKLSYPLPQGEREGCAHV